MPPPDYRRTCFVVMPFGRKSVGLRRIWRTPFWYSRVADFDHIYATVFKPAIESVELPEGGRLVCRRADDDLFSGIVTDDVWRYLEYSRFVLADISGGYPNVFLELGVRFRARSAGTAVFRQSDATIPFDISSVRAFPYHYRPDDKVRTSRALVQSVIANSMKELREDSPIRVALGAQRGVTESEAPAEALLVSAEGDLLKNDLPSAIAKHNEALDRFEVGPLVRQRLAILLKDTGRFLDAVEELKQVTEMMPTNAAAFRELGIALNKVFSAASEPARVGLDSGERALRRAIALEQHDYDALASLGGLLARDNRLTEALHMYERASDESGGHPYPVLNEIRVGAKLRGLLELTPRQESRLSAAEQLRLIQSDARPPADAPWCYYDLGMIRLYRGKIAEFEKFVRLGDLSSTAAWQRTSFREALRFLLDVANITPDQRTSVERVCDLD
jgi:tetratricopeptide (TPR) repeat protein